MKFDALVKLTRGMACFDLALLVQAFKDPRPLIRVQLSRWVNQGKVIGLRRGIYTLADAYRQAAITPAVLANQLYRPSYLGSLWALGFYDLIPEQVVMFTSVTSRIPRRFENAFGVYDYRNVKQAFFFGYHTVVYGGAEIMVAHPEKALLDHWHLSRGEWTMERLAEMRYQQVGLIQPDRLLRYAARFQSPRLDRATRRWLAMTVEAEREFVTL